MKIGRIFYNNDFAVIVEHDSVFYKLATPNVNHVLSLEDPLSLPHEEISLENVKLLAPTFPRKIIGIGRNYTDHAREFGNPIPDEPLFFLKPATSTIGPGDPIVYPRQTQNLHYEGELALVMRKHVKDKTINELAGISNLFGITAFNDVTARDLQQSDKTWARGKGFDTFAPTGPWINLDTTKGEYNIKTIVNGEVKQDSSTKNMKFQFLDIISYLSNIMTLEVGDVIATGTPAGVGPLQPEDIVTVYVEDVGELTNPVIKVNNYL